MDYTWGMKWTWFVFIAVVLVVLSGCRTNDELSATPNPTIPTRTLIPNQAVNNAETSEQTAAINEPLVLRVWSNTSFSPEANPILIDQINQFGIENNSEIDVRVKDVDGLATTLNYLRTGHTIAPDLMPDLILLNDSEVNSALADELLAQVDVGGVNTIDWYPIGRDLVVSTDEQTMIGWPIAFIDLHHVVWNQASFTETFTTWDEWLETDVILGVPADNQAAASLALAHYTGAPNEPFDETVMIAALAQVGRAAEHAVVGSPLTDPRVNGELILANQFIPLLNDETLIPSALPNPPTAGLWLWGITTDDPDRQAAALDLLTWLNNGENSGALTQSLQLIPANRSAFDFWVARPYAEFLGTYLENARLRPSQFPLRNTLNLATLTMLTDPNADAAAVYQMITDTPLRR